MIELKLYTDGLAEKMDEGGLAHTVADKNVLQIGLLVSTAITAGKRIEMYGEIDDGELVATVYKFIDTSDEEFDAFLEFVGEIMDDDTIDIENYFQNGGEL